MKQIKTALIGAVLVFGITAAQAADRGNDPVVAPQEAGFSLGGGCCYNGLKINGFRLNGIFLQGFRLNGIFQQGLSFNGLANTETTEPNNPFQGLSQSALAK